ncbi:YggT family protein [Candidatus Dojkabacteria bacterium]|nr:YggT family protein [Candidatus Dojkabacteria bacterium]
MIFRILAQIFYTILLIIETLISFRFIFKLFGANPDNDIVRLIYDLSYIFVRPFVGILTGDWKIGRFYIDIDAVIALIVYMIIAFVVVEIIKAFRPSVTRRA